MAETALLSDLLYVQAPVVIVLGLCVWWLQIRYLKSQEKLEKSQDEKSAMARDMIQFVKVIKEDRDKEKIEKDNEMLNIMRGEQENNKKILDALQGIIHNSNK